MLRPPVTVTPFDTSIIAEFSGNLLKLGVQAPQANYLHDYLNELGAQTVVYEPHYVDRHYLDDYTHYYASAFATPPPHCSRFHFFNVPIAQMESLFERGFRGDHVNVEREIAEQRSYLGFVVRRPLPAAPIGRTVLRTYPAEGRESPDGNVWIRNFQAVRAYRANLCGLSLSIEGLAYQQQDGGAAVCASVALWSSLQSVASIAGHRTPTPVAITRASGTPFPAADGLGTAQMATALSTLGYLAETFAPGPNRAEFRAKIVACLDSHLPVILLIKQKRKSLAADDAGMVVAGHAVALTGYSEPKTILEVPPTLPGEIATRMRSASLEVVYTHDDNLGSHAHYELYDVDDRDEDGHKILRLYRGRRGKPAKPWWTPDEWDVFGALVCKPPKLRTSLKELLSEFRLVRPFVERRVLPGLDVHYSAHFTSGVRLKRELFNLPLDADQMRAFQMASYFPRHVGVVRAYVQDTHVLDLVLDATQVRRDPPLPLLGVVAPGAPVDSVAEIALRGLRAMGLPVITAARQLPALASSSPIP